MRAHPAIARFREETAPTAAEVAELRAVVDASRVPTDALLQELPGVAPDEVMRLVAAVRQRRGEERAGLPGWIFPAGFGLAGASALAAAFVVGVGAIFAFREPPSAQPLAIELASEAAPREVGIARGIEVVFDGRGTVAGTATAPEVRWTSGTISVEVEPGQGLTLAVVTREAEVRVIGTAFDVRRDQLGTTVVVEHGRVAVTCTAGGVALLGAGESMTCLPTTAPALLARAQALRDAGADPEDVLATLDLARPLANEPVSEAEIAVTHIQMRLALGERSRAFDEAEAWLATGRPERRPDVLAIAAALALESGGCEWARPYAEELATHGPLPRELAPCSSR